MLPLKERAPSRTTVFSLTLALLVAGLYLAALRPLRRGLTVSSIHKAAFGGMSDDEPAAGSLSEWLRGQKRAFLADLEGGGSLQAWTLTTGNEAGDLDSLASAIAFSYIQSVFRANPGRHLPLVQSERADLPLRQENQRALDDAGVSPSSLLWLDEARVERAFEQSARLMLVDHNRAASRFGAHPDVRAVIDHHEDEGLYLDASPRVVTPGIGSCTSLVTTHYTQYWQVTERTDLLRSLASLLRDAMLIDTHNFKDSKATETDRKARALLEPFVGASAARDDAPERFELLSRLKSDVSRLSARDLLRRDYKQFESAHGLRCGFSSVPLDLDDWSEPWQPATADWAAERDLDVAFVLTSYDSRKKHKHRKDVAVVVARPSEALVRAVDDAFPRAGDMLGLEDAGSVRAARAGQHVRHWRQTELAPTRKQIAPAALRALEDVPGRGGQGRGE